MKTKICAAVVGGLMLSGLCSYGADLDAVTVADDLDIQGIKKMEIVTTNGFYYMVVTADLANRGARFVSLENGIVEVWLDAKGGKRRVPAFEVMRTEGKTVTTNIIYVEVVTAPFLLGIAEIGEGNKAILFKAASAGKPSVVEQDLAVNIGKENSPDTNKKIVGTMNLMGNPKMPYVVKLKIATKAKVGIRPETMIGVGGRVEVDATLSPATDQQYLVKN